MKALRLAFAIVRIPQLFVALLLFPLIVGVFLAVGQLLITALYLGAVNRSSAVVAAEYETPPQHYFVKDLLRGEKYERAELCVWSIGHDGVERPPRPECEMGSLDVVLRPSMEPVKFDQYRALFAPLTPRLHLCRTCRSALVIDASQDPPVTSVFDLWAMPIVGAVTTEAPELRSTVIHTIKTFERYKNIFGEISLQLPGFRESIRVVDLKISCAIVLSISATLVITLWLAWRAHRRVLDYFGRSGALLPLVASCGKETFYGALWWITGFRVGGFLLAAIPTSIIVYSDLVDTTRLSHIMGSDRTEFSVWIISITLGLAAAMAMASVGELRHRRPIVSVLWTYGPIIIWAIGGLLWIVTMLLPSAPLLIVRNILTVIPIMGVTPVLIAPAFKISTNLIVLHALFAALVTVMILRANARWFGAHLEEL